MTVRVGINGFGRIGRNFFRAAKERGVDIDFVAVNDLGSLATMAHLLKYDSVLGTLPNKIAATANGISVDGDELRVLQERDPKKLPWGELGVDVVIESTGFFTKRDTAAYHLEAGAPLVIVSSPCDGADATFVYGVNHTDFDFATQKVISNASCTTNCFVPLVKVLDDAFGVEQGLMQTVHAYTGDQQLVDGPHHDLRRARGAAINSSSEIFSPLEILSRTSSVGLALPDSKSAIVPRLIPVSCESFCCDKLRRERRRTRFNAIFRAALSDKLSICHYNAIIEIIKSIQC
ncbi:MAG: type I glyceraldehyde-3-phosphate dehydrogenase [Pyrinomonadaceae bacterium]